MWPAATAFLVSVLVSNLARGDAALLAAQSTDESSLPNFSALFLAFGEIVGTILSEERFNGMIRCGSKIWPGRPAEDYRARAEACVHYAENTLKVGERQALLNLAKTYMCLADEAEEREDLLDDVPRAKGARKFWRRLE
jgi:hypothetical protein